MRLVLTALISFGLAGSAFAQTPQVSIEDDVSHANAVACAGLRAAQVKTSPDALLTATHAAWMKSLTAAGHDAAKVQKEVADEAAKLASASPATLKAKADACAPFEIR